jgi:hypothetical protein
MVTKGVLAQAAKKQKMIWRHRVYQKECLDLKHQLRNEIEFIHKIQSIQTRLQWCPMDTEPVI